MRFIPILLSALLLCACDVSVSKQEKVDLSDAGENKGRKAALASAQEFVVEVDKSNYGGTWEMLSPLITNDFDKSSWEEMLANMRKVTGAPKNRNFVGAAYTESLPNAPKGSYFYIELNTDFSNVGSATEKVIMKLEGSEWKIAGYHYEKTKKIGNIKDLVN